MIGEGLEVGQLDAGVVDAFAEARRAEAVSSIARRPRSLLTYLRELGVVRPERDERLSPLAELIGSYRGRLLAERELATLTVTRYEALARRFLGERVRPGDALGVQELRGDQVAAFLLRECQRLSVASAKGKVGELRSLLRFLFVRRFTKMALAGSVPAVAGWRDTEIPRLMPCEDVERLIACCDRSTLDGARDVAMMLLAARLGLRSVEIARLQLDDLDWRAGELVVRGKGGRGDPLPIPDEVGAALAGYLARRGRQDSRRVFMTLRAPTRPIGADLIGDVVRRGCKGAGVRRVGPHRLRHALASEMLARGASLVDISQVAPQRSVGDRALRKSGSRPASSGRAFVARSSMMSALERHVNDYLRLRRTLGDDLTETGRLLLRFVSDLDAARLEHVTTALAVEWSLAATVTAPSTVPATRYMAVRGFARYMSGIDPRTEIPPAGMLRLPRSWRPPFIYTDDEVLALLEQARSSISQPLRAATMETLIGLLACSGLRVGEALRLDRGRHRLGRSGAAHQALEVQQVAARAARAQHHRRP